MEEKKNVNENYFYLGKQSHISSCFDNIEMFSMRFHSALFEMKKRSGCGNFEKHGAYANQLANTSSLENLKGKNFTETDGVYEVPNNGKITLLSLILLPMPLVWKPIQIPLYISLKNFSFPLDKVILGDYTK